MSTPTPPRFSVADAAKTSTRGELIQALLKKADVTLEEVSDMPMFVLLEISRAESWKEKEVGAFKPDTTCYHEQQDIVRKETVSDTIKLANIGQFDAPLYLSEKSILDPMPVFFLARTLLQVRAEHESALLQAQLRAAAFAGKDLVRQTRVFAAKERTPSEQRKKVSFPADESMVVKAKHFIKGEPIDFVDEAPLDVECPASEGEEKKEKSETEIGAKPASFQLRVRSSASSFSAIRVRAAAAAAEEKKLTEIEGAVEPASVPAKQARAAMAPLVRVASFSARPGAPNFSSAGKVPFPKPKRTAVKLQKQRAGASSFSTLRLLATVAAVDAEAKEAEATPPTKSTTRAALPALKVRVASFAVRPGAPSFGTLGKEIAAA